MPPSEFTGWAASTADRYRGNEEIVPGNYYKLTPRSVVKFWRPA